MRIIKGALILTLLAYVQGKATQTHALQMNAEDSEKVIRGGSSAA